MDTYIIIGAGPAGLMAAQTLAEKGKKVVVYEQKPAAARKFLVAGHGGFNLTHSMPYEQMLTAYEPTNLLPYIERFTNIDVQHFLAKIGIDLFVGSSGKVFPIKGTKPIDVLKAWLAYLEKLKVSIHYAHTLVDFNEHQIILQNTTSTFSLAYKKLIIALGGASWPQTGATGKWVNLFKSKGIGIKPLVAANAGLVTTTTYPNIAGKNFKNVTLRHNDTVQKGEFLFTEYGIEGSIVYFLNRSVRKNPLPQTIYLNLKPGLSPEALKSKWEEHPKLNTTQKLKQILNLDATAIQLLKQLNKPSFTHDATLLHLVQHFPIEVIAFRPIEEAISSAGGIKWDALNDDLSLHLYPNIHCIGEMLDWDTPTGGFLLQACFAMGHYIGSNIK